MTTTLSAKSVDEILDECIPIKYPDYNLGLLPDEEGYDEAQLSQHYYSIDARDELKSELYQLIKDRVIKEDEEAPATLYDKGNAHFVRAKRIPARNELRASQRAVLNELFGVKDDENGDLLK